MTTEATAWQLCFTCTHGKINKEMKGTDSYIQCMIPRIHPTFKIPYFVYLKHPLISCNLHQSKKLTEK